MLHLGRTQPYAFLNLKSPPSLAAEEAAMFYFTPGKLSSPGPIPLSPKPKYQIPRGLGLTLKSYHCCTVALVICSLMP